ncbi:MULTISPECIES: hypothetical protein [unclassified Streptomyces]|uniref:hypothetical protein n=1 Tax=unclassified Streptomyces TaxID=2593676 RepID=UPI00380DE91E
MGSPAPSRVALIVQDLECGLAADHSGEHYGFVCELTEAGETEEAGGFWAPWTDSTPAVLVRLPDCPAVTTDGMDACSSFGGHPGLHLFYEDT